MSKTPVSSTQANDQSPANDRSPADDRPADSEPSDAAARNPKTNPDATGASNQIKDPDDWVTGGEPMTGAQASYLKTLSEQAHKPEAFDPDLDKADASKRIDDLKEQTGR